MDDVHRGDVVIAARVPRRYWREFGEDLGRLLDLFAAGSLRAQVGRRVPLREAGTALEAHVAGGFTGKIVLETAAGSGAA